MDALVSKQKVWKIPSSALRDRLRNLLKESILPLYESFYEKFSNVQFSKKHMGQYLRYPPKEVEKVLSTLFRS